MKINGKISKLQKLIVKGVIYKKKTKCKRFIYLTKKDNKLFLICKCGFTYNLLILFYLITVL